MQFDSCESLQPLIPICPSGDVSKRTKEALMDTLPPAPVHPFRPSMPLFSSIQNNKPFRNSTRGSWPSVVCTAAPEFFFLLFFFFPLPFAKAPASPRSFQAAEKSAALSAKCGRCFSRISWPREYCSSPPECKRSTLCCHPTCPACLLSWMVGEASAAVAVISEGTLKTKEKVLFPLGSPRQTPAHLIGPVWLADRPRVR